MPPDQGSGERFRPFPAPIGKKLGLVCAGGGVTGAIYEIGALAALEDRLENASITDFDVFVGVSAGAYISALLANGVTPSLLFRNATRSAEARTDVDDLNLFRVNFEEIASRLAKAPFTLLDAAWDYYKNRHETTLTDLVQAFGQLLPSGIFHNEGLEAWMRDWLTRDGRTNDFRKLAKTLRIVAVDLDSGNTAAFGCEGHDDVPISQAVAASCAIPGLYRPVKIKGVDYIDGGVKKTAHISLSIRERCGLTICVNPLVPVRFRPADTNGAGAGALRRRGLPTILDQVFRVTLHSRLKYGLGRYRREAPAADVVVFEPRPEDLPRYMRNIMRTSGRIRIAEYAYRSTMATLDADFKRLSKVFAAHGLILRPACTRDRARVKTHADRASDIIPTRLAASLATLEADLERMTAARGR
ncbi:MAG TPA: patatin-like phospholipase family protein [Thermoanaerobaculia bacterium]|nr:patatin-like phospholipase family protein [Thermoanaerobaculia bacterium]